ncbi:MAG: 5'/3'-nucleotidase SurE [Bradymonadales bacterium]|nr:5'/3'-nucleotidase SurE [Bradymonadales bacterium]
MEPLIMVTNDDGFEAPGLQTLVKFLGGLGRLLVVAPERPSSAASHAITLHKPLRLWKRQPGRYVLSGSPADCVFFAFSLLCEEQLPSVVVSGINRGANLGNDVFYSGTVAGAMEGALLGAPGVAVSQVMTWGEEYGVHGYRDPEEFEPAGRVVARVVEQVLSCGVSPDVVLNINIPPAYDESKGLKVTRLGRRLYSRKVLEKRDPRGLPYYWNAGTDTGFASIPDSDCVAIDEGYATLTPLRADMTHDSMLEQIKGWCL